MRVTAFKHVDRNDPATIASSALKESPCTSCGNISRSEDLAQDVFITAWRQLRDLKESGKPRAWLYGIARNLINNSFRRQTRTPLSAAEPLDESLETGPELSGQRTQHPPRRNLSPARGGQGPGKETR